MLSLCLRLSFLKMRQIDIHFCWKILHQWQSLIKHRLHINCSIQWDTEIWGENGFEFNFCLKCKWAKVYDDCEAAWAQLLRKRNSRVHTLFFEYFLFSTLQPYCLTCRAIFCSAFNQLCPLTQVFLFDTCFSIHFDSQELCPCRGMSWEELLDSWLFKQLLTYFVKARVGCKKFSMKTALRERVCCIFFEKFMISVWEITS